MKHLLNNLSEDEKNSIREQHSRRKTLVKEFFDYGDNNQGYFKKMAEQLSKVMMLSISVIGREKTIQLLNDVSEMLSMAENTSDPNRTSDYDYSIVDLKSSIEEYLNEN